MGVNILDVVGGVGRVVNGSVNLVASVCVNVGQEPVAQNISLDPPGEGQLSLLVDKIDKACFRIANTSRSLLDGENVGLLLGFGNSGLGRETGEQDHCPQPGEQVSELG